jgi:hypothetical protein
LHVFTATWVSDSWDSISYNPAPRGFYCYINITKKAQPGWKETG